MIGEYSDLLFFLPILIRVAVITVVLAALYDYLKRKWAKFIVDTIVAAGADSPETALSTAELNERAKGFGRAAWLLLRKYSPLRRYVLSTTDGDLQPGAAEADAIKNENENAETSRYINKKEAKIKKRGKKPAREVKKLTGEERWYILADKRSVIGVSADESDEVPKKSLPYLLRDGAEPKLAGVIVGCVLLIVFGEIAIHYLPKIMDFFVKLSEIEGK